MTVSDSGHAISRSEAQALLDAWVRPAVRGHGGDVHIVDVSDQGDVTVEFTGACQACPLRPVTFGTAIQPVFDGVAGVRSVRCESVRISPHAIRRMAEMMRPASR